MTILENMDKQTYSKSEQKVYLTIKEDPLLIESASITFIASLSQVSTSAVLRFCQTLGFKGYKDFRYALINELHNRIPNQYENDYFYVLDDLSSSLNKLKTINTKLIDQLIQDINNCKRIYVNGNYYSSLPAKKLQYGLEDLSFLSILSNNSIDTIRKANTINSDSLIITFSSRGANSDHKAFIDAISDDKPKYSWLITCNPHSQISKFYNNVIVLPVSPEQKRNHIGETMMILLVDLIINHMQNKGNS